MPRSDSSPAFTSGVRLWAFPDRSACADTEEVSRFSCMQLLSVPGVYDYAGPLAGSRYRRRVCGLPPQVTGSASRIRFSQLNTLPTDPSIYASTAASRLPPQDSRPGGSLLLSCKALSSSTACRFIPAHYLTPLSRLPFFQVALRAFGPVFRHDRVGDC